MARRAGGRQVYKSPAHPDRLAGRYPPSRSARPIASNTRGLGDLRGDRFGGEDLQLYAAQGGAAIAAFLGVGYVFLDASTRGQFTWPLRLVAVVAFAAIYVAMASLR